MFQLRKNEKLFGDIDALSELVEQSEMSEMRNKQDFQSFTVLEIRIVHDTDIIELVNTYCPYQFATSSIVVLRLQNAISRVSESLDFNVEGDFDSSSELIIRSLEVFSHSFSRKCLSCSRRPIKCCDLKQNDTRMKRLSMHRKTYQTSTFPRDDIRDDVVRSVGISAIVVTSTSL